MSAAANVLATGSGARAGANDATITIQNNVPAIEAALAAARRAERLQRFYDAVTRLDERIVRSEAATAGHREARAIAVAELEAELARLAAEQAEADAIAALPEDERPAAERALQEAKRIAREARRAEESAARAAAKAARLN